MRLDRGHARVGDFARRTNENRSHQKAPPAALTSRTSALATALESPHCGRVPAARLLRRPSKPPVRILRDRRHWVSHPPHRRSRVDSLNRGRHGSHAQPDDIRWTAACVQTTCAVAAMIAGGTAMISGRMALADSPTNGATPLQAAAQTIAPARKPVTQDAQAAATDVYPSRCAGIRP